MVRGFCSVCKKEVGTFLKPHGYQCEKCLDIFCMDCAKKVGLIIKRPVCPKCGIELVDSIKKEQLREVSNEAKIREKAREEAESRIREEQREEQKEQKERELEEKRERMAKVRSYRKKK
jgi:predicted  nucleic acid-binding Zn-ribbon protein